MKRAERLQKIDFKDSTGYDVEKILHILKGHSIHTAKLMLNHALEELEDRTFVDTNFKERPLDGIFDLNGD